MSLPGRLLSHIQFLNNPIFDRTTPLIMEIVPSKGFWQGPTFPTGSQLSNRVPIYRQGPTIPTGSQLYKGRSRLNHLTLSRVTVVIQFAISVDPFTHSWILFSTSVIMNVPKAGQEANGDRFCHQERFQIFNWQKGSTFNEFWDSID